MKPTQTQRVLWYLMETGALSHLACEEYSRRDGQGIITRLGARIWELIHEHHWPITSKLLEGNRDDHFKVYSLDPFAIAKHTVLRDELTGYDVAKYLDRASREKWECVDLYDFCVKVINNWNSAHFKDEEQHGESSADESQTDMFVNKSSILKGGFR